MFSGSSMKKIVTILVIVMIASFTIAALIFFEDYGENGFAALEKGIRPSNAVDVDEEKTEAVTGIKNIKVSTPSHDITFIPVDTNEVKAHFYGYYKSSNENYKPEFTVVSAGGELTIKVEHKPTIGAITVNSNLKLDIYLPRSYSENLEITTSSAEVYIDELNLNSFICTRTSGDLEARLVNSKYAKLDTSSGETSISGKFEDFNFNATSGDFSTDGITAADANFNVSSGKIKGNISADTLQLHSTSGDLTIDPVKAKKCTIETSSGQAILRGIPGEVQAASSSGDISLEYLEYSHNIKINTASGKIVIKLPQNPEFALSYKTSSGSGKCDFPITVTGTQHRNNLEGVVTSDRNKITVTSSSGDLTIGK